MNTYAIKYTTHRMRGFKYYFGQGVIVDHVVAELCKAVEGVRVLGFNRRPVA